MNAQRAVSSSSDSPDAIPGEALLSRLADELAAAAVMGSDCQEALGEALSEVFGQDMRRDLAERLQRLDELTQRLGDLAGLVERLACSGVVRGAAPAEILDGLRLSDLKARLSGAAAAAVAGGEPEIW